MQIINRLSEFDGQRPSRFDGIFPDKFEPVDENERLLVRFVVVKAEHHHIAVNHDVLRGVRSVLPIFHEINRHPFRNVNHDAVGENPFDIHHPDTGKRRIDIFNHTAFADAENIFSFFDPRRGDDFFRLALFRLNRRFGVEIDGNGFHPKQQSVDKSNCGNQNQPHDENNVFFSH